ncbi:MAG: tyrosine-type recombinase/integrase [Methanothrix sp.]|nr:tyrosine-type recombinase/integrase [Methanothrix sp.]
MRQKLQAISWDLPGNDTKLRRFKRYLKNRGVRPSTLEDYLFRVSKYFEFCGDKEPSPEMAQKYRDHLLDRNLSNSSVANYSFAIKDYHKMLGQDIKFPNLKRANEIPFFFTSSEVNKIFDKINNIKHLAMFKTAFYACLRASELCNLDIEDINLVNQALIVRDGKGGKTAVAYLSEEAVETLREYLSVRPDFELEGRRPLFFTDYGSRFNRKEIYRLTIYFKERAGITKKGGAHVLFRHTPASLMVKNGCDLLTIQLVMRHNNITTTMRYLHLADDVKRSKYDQFLRL